MGGISVEFNTEQSSLQTWLAMCKGSVGALILFLPGGLKQCGIVAGVLAMTLSCILTVYGSWCLLDAKRIVEAHGNSVAGFTQVDSGSENVRPAYLSPRRTSSGIGDDGYGHPIQDITAPDGEKTIASSNCSPASYHNSEEARNRKTLPMQKSGLRDKTQWQVKSQGSDSSVNILDRTVLVSVIAADESTLLIDGDFRVSSTVGFEESYTQSSDHNSASNGSDVLIDPTYMKSLPELRVDSYAKLGRRTRGALYEHLVNSSISVMQTAYCCVYIVFISDNVSQALSIRRSYFITVLVSLGLLPFACLPNLKRLSFINFFGNIVFVAVLILFFVFDGLVLNDNYQMKPCEERNRSLRLWNWSGLSIFMGMAGSAFEGLMPLMFPIYKAAKTKHNFLKLLISVLVMLFLIETFFSVINYVTFRQCTNDQITLNLPDTIVSSIFQIGYCLVIFFTYPLIIFPVVEMIGGLIRSRTTFQLPHSQHLHNWSNLYHRSLFVVLLVVLTCVTAMFGGDNLSLFVSFIGAFSGIPLSFIYPMWFHAAVTPSRWHRRIDYTICVFGLLLMILSCYSSIQDWTEPQDN